MVNPGLDFRLCLRYDEKKLHFVSSDYSPGVLDNEQIVDEEEMVASHGFKVALKGNDTFWDQEQDPGSKMVLKDGNCYSIKLD